MKINLIYKGLGLVSHLCPRAPGCQTSFSTPKPGNVLQVCVLRVTVKAEHICQANNCPCLGFLF